MHAESDEHREFLRVDHEISIHYQEVRPNGLSHKTDILTRNISPSGLLFRTKNIPPAISSIVAVEPDPKMLNICSEIEADLIIRNNRIFGRVVRIAEGEPGLSYDVGICFLRKKELTDKEIEELLPESNFQK